MSIFSKIERNKVRSNTFDLTHDVKLTTQFGRLTPCMVMDCIPGDKVNLSGNALVRLAPMTAPVMHRANIYIHYFFVPNRIMWPNWEDFITGGREGTDNSVHPYIMYDTGNPGNTADLAQFLGLPTASDVGNNVTAKVNAFPFSAFQKIYNDYFRDQNFEDDIDFALVDGDNTTNGNLKFNRKRAWRHDYFTSALPWTQRGPEALLPLGNEAPLVPEDPNDVMQFLRDAQGNPVNGGLQVYQNSLDGRINYDAAGIPAYVAVEESHKVDLTAATAASINDLRRAFRLQEWLERNARGGSRYIESIQAHFGVSSSDKRLQRAEYIGGFQSPIKFSEVLQTSTSSMETTPGDPNTNIVQTPQGNMAGHGISVGGSKNYSYFCEEHGYIIGILSALPDTAYQQGIEKHWLRFDKFDYAWPEFAHIGEQEIVNNEIYMVDDGTENDTWGYVPRYAEYKFMNNRVAGAFRNSLDFWHMGRKFASPPALNQDFVQMDFEEVERIWAVTDEDPLWIQVLNQVKAKRKLPYFGTPTI